MPKLLILIMLFIYSYIKQKLFLSGVQNVLFYIAAFSTPFWNTLAHSAAQMLIFVTFSECAKNVIFRFISTCAIWIEKRRGFLLAESYDW